MGKTRKKQTAGRTPELSVEETARLEALGEVWSESPDPADDDAVNRVVEQCRSSESLSWRAVDLAVENPSQFSVRVLTELEALHENKPFRKEVKRALHQLKERGFDRDSRFEKPKRGVYRKAEKREPSAYVSSIDHSGARIVILSAPRDTMGTRAAISMLNETKGFVEFKSMEMSQSDFKGFLKLFEKDNETKVYPTGVGHACLLFKQAESLTSDSGELPPPGYAEWKDWIAGFSPVPTEPLIFEYVSKEEIESNPLLLKRSDELIKDDMVLSWILDLEEAEPYIRKLRNAGDSSLILSEAQKRDRVAGVYEQAVKTLFTVERRERMKRRLEETAYLLWKEEKEDLARIAAAASLDVTGEHQLVPENPFLLNLVEASISLWAQTEGEEDDESGKEADSPLIVL